MDVAREICPAASVYSCSHLIADRVNSEHFRCQQTGNKWRLTRSSEDIVANKMFLRLMSASLVSLLTMGLLILLRKTDLIW